LFIRNIYLLNYRISEDVSAKKDTGQSRLETISTVIRERLCMRFKNSGMKENSYPIVLPSGEELEESCGIFLRGLPGDLIVGFREQTGNDDQ
jgi:hypothetical protein